MEIVLNYLRLITEHFEKQKIKIPVIPERKHNKFAKCKLSSFEMWLMLLHADNLIFCSLIVVKHNYKLQDMSGMSFIYLYTVIYTIFHYHA